MKIVIDGSPLCNTATGIATYTIDAISAIVKYLPNWQIYLTLPKEIHPSIKDLPIASITIVKVSLPFIKKRVPWIQCVIPFVVRKYKADLFWSPNKVIPLVGLGSCRTMITIHDVVWKELKTTKESNSYNFVFDYIVDKSLYKADFLWYNSEYTKSRIEHYYPQLSNKPSVIGDSCNDRFKRIQIDSKAIDSIKKEYDIINGFLLFVGSLEPRKNLMFLLKIMPEVYKRTGKKLLVVGASGWKNDNIKKYIMNPSFSRDSVVFANYIDNEKLVLLYNIADCYISSALNEGFGMPQLEAMKCGCPVISPNNSAMTEVVSGNGILIDGWDEKLWIDTICSLVQSPEKMKSLQNPDVSRYSWEKIIKEIEKLVKGVG